MACSNLGRVSIIFILSRAWHVLRAASNARVLLTAASSAWPKTHLSGNRSLLVVRSYSFSPVDLRGKINSHATVVSFPVAPAIRVPSHAVTSPTVIAGWRLAQFVPVGVGQAPPLVALKLSSGAEGTTYPRTFYCLAIQGTPREKKVNPPR